MRDLETCFSRRYTRYKSDLKGRRATSWEHAGEELSLQSSSLLQSSAHSFLPQTAGGVRSVMPSSATEHTLNLLHAIVR